MSRNSQPNATTIIYRVYRVHIIEMFTPLLYICVCIQGAEYNPSYMLTPFGTVMSQQIPVSLSAYRTKHRTLIDAISNSAVEAGAHVIDFSDNMCWNDVCEVFDSYGRPVMRDNDHFRVSHDYYFLI